jgi:hypothetical protein
LDYLDVQVISTSIEDLTETIGKVIEGLDRILKPPFQSLPRINAFFPITLEQFVK